jgi:serine/threonine-protein kinase
VTPDQRRAVERLYDEALARPRGLRAAFVAEACAGDDLVRSEVESLLAQDASRPGPLDGRAIEVAAAMVSGSVAALSAGQRIGVYEVVEPVGAGGMGQVYRAHDTVLGRDVAIKIIPSAWADDVADLARFEREARVLASLNHPHIAGIYGVETTDEARALILEFVDGETLAQRIARGALPVAESLAIARQLCDALEAAHARGIVHRDLKPANVKITLQGAVKVLDFGIAKVMSPENAMAASAIHIGGIASTMVGTAAYMSPEQARGQTVDRRTDVWAFGCVLYEMLTGRPVFLAGTMAHTLTAVLEDEPDWDRLPHDLPAAVRRLLVRCLQKDAARRLRDIGDARLEIEDGTGDAGIVSTPVATGQRQSDRRTITRRVAALFGVSAVAAIVGFAYRPLVSPAVVPPVSRSIVTMQPFDMRSPSSQNAAPPVARPDRTAIALSPDGQTIVWRAQTDNGVKLYRRSLDRLEPAVIEGTDGADSPFFSPDGQWLAFWAEGELRRISLGAGGPPTTICAIPNSGGPTANDPKATPSPTDAPVLGATWGDGGRIVFATGLVNDRALWEVTIGGQPRLIAKPAAGELSYRLPHLLPGGESVLFTIVRTMFWWDDAQVAVRSLITGEQRVLLEDAADARYVPTGHLVFMRDGTMMAAPFDPERLEVTGEPMALIDGVMHAVNAANSNTDSGAAQLAIAPRGTLVYVTGGIVPQPRRALVWAHPDGSIEKVPVPVDAYYSPRISPIDSRLAVFTSALGVPRLWVLHPDGTRNAVTTPQERGAYGLWTRDARSIVFTSGRNVDDIYRKLADGTGPAERLHDGQYETMGSSWTADGKLIVVHTHPETNQDVALLDVSPPDGDVTHVLESRGREFYRYPELSPDGRWLAYTSNVSGLPQVYVQPFPGPGRVVPVSAGIGVAPAWRRDGQEMYYLAPSPGGAGLTMVAVDVRQSTDPEVFNPGRSRPLFSETPSLRFAGTTPTRNYDVSPDGSRFLMVQQLEAAPEPPASMVLVQNWSQELKRLVPSDAK